MTTSTVPNPVEAQAAITDYLTVPPLGPVSDARRERIIKNCLGPIVLLIEAVRLAGAAGPEEEAVLIQFIRALYMQSEHVKQEFYFANLLAKLSAHRPSPSP